MSEHPRLQDNRQLNFALPIRLTLKPSRWITTTVSVLYAGACICTLFANISPLIMLIMSLIACASFSHWYYNNVYSLKRSNTQLILTDKDEWYISDDNTDKVLWQLSPISFVHKWLIVLTLQQGRHKKHIILSFDNVSKPTFRYLSVRLRFSLS